MLATSVVGASVLVPVSLGLTEVILNEVVDSKVVEWVSWLVDVEGSEVLVSSRDVVDSSDEVEASVLDSDVRVTITVLLELVSELLDGLVLLELLVGVSLEELGLLELLVEPALEELKVELVGDARPN